MSSALSFLDLPYNVRLKIYGYSGLIRPCPIELNIPDGDDPKLYGDSWEEVNINWECLYIIHKRGCDRGRGSGGPNHPDCSCSKLPTQLLYVSRGFYEDSFLVLYSSNKFVLRAQSSEDLGLLMRLNSHVLATMNSLLIRLNSWPCLRGHDDALPDNVTCFNCNNSLSNSNYALNVTSPTGRRLLAEWTKLSLHLASSITPKQMRLTFICDVVDFGSAKLIIEPISRLPPLKQCTIRLSREPNYELSALARDTSAQITQSFIRSSQPFPFRRLPRELQFSILGYTHLGRHSNYHSSDDLLRIEKGKLVRSNRGYVSPFSKCCRKCTETLIDCCCFSAHAAYTATCACRRIPFGLFFVDKEMRRDALAMLLDQNCFDFMQDPEKTIDFLSRFPIESLGHIQQIQFQFTEMEFDEWTEKDYSRKWLALVSFLKCHLKVRQLSIVVIADTFDLGCGAYYGDKTREIYDIYCEITRPLRMLGGVRNMRFDLGWLRELGPLMSRAVAGEGHEELYPELVFIMGRYSPGRVVPHWLRKTDFTRDVELSSK